MPDAGAIDITSKPRHSSLAAALAAFHADAPKVVKDATAKVTGESKSGAKVSYTYEYADLATVTEALNPLLGRHGLAFVAKPTMTPEGFGLAYALIWDGGDREEGFWPLPDMRGMKPQDLGSWITYWRRYAFLAVTNTFPSGEDDDGATAQAATRQDAWDNASRQRPERPVSAAPAAPKPPKVWTDAEVFDYQAKISSSDVTLAVKGYDWMASNDLHERKVDYPTGDALTATQVLAFRLADLAVQPDVDLRGVAIIRAYAEDRGLLGVGVSDSTTLGEELDLARDLASSQETTEAPAGSGD